MKYSTLYVYDCDGTLLNTHGPETGKPLYEKLTGRRWMHRGWWGRPESIDLPMPAPVITSTLEAYRAALNDPAGRVVILTGRLVQIEQSVRNALRRAGIEPGDELYLNPGTNSTLQWKLEVISRMLTTDKIPRLRIWEDRPEQAAGMELALHNLATVTTTLVAAPPHILEV